MEVYAHTLLLILLGAVLNESGLKITSTYFWLVVIILFGLFLTYDMILSKQDRQNDKDDTEP